MRPLPFVLLSLAALSALPAQAPKKPPTPMVVVAEGERFTPLDKQGWKVTHQDDSYASHTYGGMWMTHGGCLGAPADSVDSVATQKVSIPKAGKYRVWSKYQAPPYFNYLHRVEVRQGGKVVFTHDYGKSGTPRLWSFSGVSDELFWYWGVDHDAAEAPKTMADLAAGEAEVRLVTLKNPAPAGDRFVDFIVLTTNPDDSYTGFKPMGVGTPFAFEALAATKLTMRFQNTTAAPAQLTVTRAGHFQPNYGGATAKYPAAPVAAGQWSAWFDIGPFCRLVHDEGLWLTLAGGKNFGVQFARDRAGKQLAGDMKIDSGEAVVVPIDITWNPKAVVKPSRVHAEEIIAASKTWRRVNGGKKPEKIRFYGAFNGTQPWVGRLEDAIGYNTNLPDGFAQIRPSTVAQHYGTGPAIRALHKGQTEAQRKNTHVISFGDEIALGRIDYKDPKLNAAFRAWLAAKGVTAKDLGVAPASATLGNTPARVAWYSALFEEERVFAGYREATKVAEELYGPKILTGANYSPHHLALYYGSIPQWVDIFEQRGMSMFWAEDYVFSVPEVPQIVSWMLGQIRCATKYHRQPIHLYIMPHEPGQVPGFLRRNLLTGLGNGASHIDNFWVAPAETFTENYVRWGARDTFRTIGEAVYEAGEIEAVQQAGRVRPARVAVVTGKATDFHESRLMGDKKADAFLARCANAPDKVNQTLCRKDQQYLYLALRQAQHAVDLVTEKDIVAGRLKDYDVVYFAGEWIDRAAVKTLDAWVKAGGTLYATAGLGVRNEFDEADDGLLTLLGLKAAATTKNAVAPRTLLELPLQKPIDTIAMGDRKIPAMGMRTKLTPGSAKVAGTWADGTAAVTRHKHGKGEAIAVGTCAGATWMHTGLRKIPYARGGRHVVYNPVDFDAAATTLVRLGVDAREPAKAAWCETPGVEATVLDAPAGTLVTLVNWTNAPQKGLTVNVRLKDKPAKVRSVRGQKEIPVKVADGVATVKVDLEEGDYLLFTK